MADRVLTVRQPWTSAMFVAGKDVENRTKPFPSTVPLGSRVWIHAAARHDRSDVAMQALVAGLRRVGEPLVFTFLAYTAAARGVVLGSVEVTGCHHADWCWDRSRGEHPDGHHCSPWAESDTWHWALADPRPLAVPVPAKGRLGLWTPDDQLAEALEQAVPA